MVGRAKFFNGGAVQWEVTVVIEQLQEVGRWVGKLNLQCMIVDNIDAYGRKITQLLSKIRLRIFDGKQHISVLIAERGL